MSASNLVSIMQLPITEKGDWLSLFRLKSCKPAAFYSLLEIDFLGRQ